MSVAVLHLMVVAILLRFVSAIILQEQSPESINPIRRRTGVAAVAAISGSSESSDEVCPFGRPCICFAGRIICAPQGPVWLQPLNAISSEAASKVMWYDLRIEGVENIDHLPSAASLSVKNLHIIRSRLFSVPVGILSELSGVLQLNLSRNMIGRLRGADFVGVPSLHQLDLAQNLLRIIDDNAFDPLSELRQLNLAMNSLFTVPNAVRVLRKLTHLDLHGNPIKRIFDYDFNHLGRLLNLDISQLSPGLIVEKRAFCGLRSVRSMGNQIKLETGLNALVMRDNDITEWDPCSLFHLSHLVRSVDFQRTKLKRCTCQAASLNKYFRLTYRGSDLISCVSRRQKDSSCSSLNCTSYCSGSDAGIQSSSVKSALTLNLTLCLIHRLIASFLDS